MTEQSPGKPFLGPTPPGAPGLSGASAEYPALQASSNPGLEHSPQPPGRIFVDAPSRPVGCVKRTNIFKQQ